MNAIIAYHKNIEKIYPAKWIEQFRLSIVSQTEKCKIYECEYGGGTNRIFEDSQWDNTIYVNFVACMNAMITKAFDEGAEYVFNTNVDDYYSVTRVQRQLLFLNMGFDLVSSNFSLVDGDGKTTHEHKFSGMNIAREITRGHNIIGHPVVAYSRKFWEHNRYDPNEIPAEDLKLWQRAINNGSRFCIIPDNLLSHRIHDNSVCKSNNR